MKQLTIYLFFLFILVSCKKDEPYGKVSQDTVYLVDSRIRNYGPGDFYCSYMIQGSDSGNNLWFCRPINLPDSLTGWQSGKRYEFKLAFRNEYTICADALPDPLFSGPPNELLQVVEILEVKRK